ncbi:ligand-binding sensor domain-containing protein [Runella salmonicolor]|uniref:Histidine kinase n=1 Tax=Runella salmonicolor TaxID=2950278 RepID=A0ABT1FH53_9BACT|nr:sensor histidine kinase [Runella salmonicolor]MCP1381097.1 histidine kinase [Runella salmonicolor]
MRTGSSLFFSLLLSCWAQILVFGQSSEISFQHLSPEQGLPIHYCTGIAQDTSGFIWIGTLAGLARYDGIRCKVFDHDRQNPHSLSDIIVRSVLLSKNGTLWVGTQHGFNRMDFKTQQFERFHFTKYGERSDYIRCIGEDFRGKLWLGSANGLILFDPKTKQSELVKLPTDPSSKPLVYSVRSLLIDGPTVWIGTDLGLYRYNIEENSFQVFCKSDELGTIPDNSVTALAKHPKTGNIIVGTRNGTLSMLSLATEHFIKMDIPLAEPREISSVFFSKDGKLWICTQGQGIFCYHENQRKFINYQSQINVPNSLSSNYVRTAFQDRSGVLWFSTAYKGISRFNPASQSFTSPLKEANYQPTTANGGAINRIAIDSKDNLWLGTDNGVVWVNQTTNTYKAYRHDPKNKNSLSDNGVNSIYVDPEDKVYVATQHFQHLDPTTGKFTIYDHLPNEAMPSPPPIVPGRHFVAGRLVYDLHPTADGRVFIGTDEGLNIFDPKTKTFANRFNDERIRRLPLNRYNSLYTDSKQNLWVGCGVDEVLCISPDLSKVTTYRYQEDNPKSLPDNGVMSFSEDSKGNIWMGTDNGLACLDPKTQSFTNYFTRHGIANNYVSALIRVRNTLWMGTANGLTRYDEQQKRFVSFGRADNLEVLSIETKSVAKDKLGNLYFGGLYGLVRFHPDRVKTNTFVPPVVITSLRVHGQEVLPTHIPQNNLPITLAHDENDLTIEAAALSYDHSENNQFSFWLEGVKNDNGWRAPTTQANISYLNVPPGEYTLHVKAANNDGVWNPAPYTLRIIINPPFWQTWWFQTLMVMLVVAIGVYIYRSRVKIIQREHATQVKLLEEQQLLQNQLNQELTEKLDFRQKFEIVQKQQVETERKAIMLEREKVLARYQGLINQLNPHFLFNSLAVLDSLIYKDHKLASKYLRQLTKVYRYLIENDDNEVVMLEQELRFARDFVSLLHMRYGTGLCVEIDIPDDLAHKKVVPVTFQNLIENAIKHNTTSLESPLWVKIREEDNYLIFENNLQKRGTVTTSNKKGLGDFRALYSYLTDRPMQVKETVDRFTVYVPLLD